MNKSIIINQIKAIVIYEFLNNFNKLEICIRNIFEKNLDKISKKDLNKLYFLYGGKIGTYINMEEEAIQLTKLQYKDKEVFKEFTIIQLLKLNKELNFIEKFKFEIQSLKNKNVVFEFYDSAIQLVNMRNILAHNTSELNFKQKHYIEILSEETINNNLSDNMNGYDASSMDEITKQIYSNNIYLKKILEILNDEME